MGKILMEDERGKERIADLKKYSYVRYECKNCCNQTFILTEVSDFPFFDVICSKCGSMYIGVRKNDKK